MKLDDSSRTVGQWRELLVQVPRPNWMQTWPFAKATRSLDQRTSRLSVLQERGAPVAMMVTQEVRLGPFHMVNLNRGPLWFSQSPTELDLQNFAAAFQSHFPPKLGRRMRWLPEWASTEESRRCFQNSTWRMRPENFQTVWLDLTIAEAVRRRNLQKKWRNALAKAEKSKLEIFEDQSGERLALFLRLYQEHLRLKRYKGSTPEFVKAEVVAALPFSESATLWAHYNSQPVAAMMFLLHGKSSSYRFGWNTPLGRATNAHYLLLWRAQEILAQRRIHFLDLGGILPGDAPGLTHFKLGLGAPPFESLPMMSYSTFF